jgi:hypothetical protein
MPEQKPRILHVPMDLNDIFPEFLENRRKEIAAIPESLARGDFKQIRTWGHNMAGCGEGYGVPAISEIGRALETAALASDAASIRLCASQLAQLVNDVEVIYV